MPSINVSSIRSGSAAAVYENSKIISKGKKCQRVELSPEKGGIRLSIAVASKKIFKNPPKPTCFDKIFGKKYVNLQVHTGEGDGYIKVNAESLRKRLGMTKEKFQNIVSQSTNLDVTEAINTEISDLNLSMASRFDVLKNEYLSKISSQTPDLFQIESGKVFFQFTPNERFDPSKPSFKKDYRLSGRINFETTLIENIIYRDIDTIFKTMLTEKIPTGPKPHIHYVVIYKKYNGTFHSFSKDSSTSNIDPSSINSLYSKFAGKPIINEDQKEFI